MAALRRERGGSAEIEGRIRQALESLRPLLHFRTCEVDLIEYRMDSGLAVLHVVGDCPDCDMSAEMLMQGIEAHLRMRVPEVREVRAAGSHP